MRARVTVPTGQVAFVGLLVFLFVVYANPGNWLEELEGIGFAKVAAALSLAALGAAWLLYDRRLTIGRTPGVLLALLSLLVGLSALWSFWPRYTVDTFLDGLKYLAIFFLVANLVDSERRLRQLVAAFAWGSLIPALGCLWSWSHGEHLVDGDRAAWIGIFANPNDLAYHLVVGVAMVLAAREATGRRALKLAYLAALVPIGVAILGTQSRGGMVAAGVVLLLWTLRSVRRAPALIGVAVALACVVQLSPGDPWAKRAESSVSHGEDVSARGRVDAWRTGLNIAEERPLTGVGAGAFVIAWPTFAPGDAGPARTEHNTFVQLLAELGVPGLLLFLGAFAAGVLGVSRAAKLPALSPYARGVQCGLAGFAVCSLSGGLAFTWPLYLLVGISVAAGRLAAPGEMRQFAALAAA
jgi:probable O-glycosylation ligase (exosortase A-associated)